MTPQKEKPKRFLVPAETLSEIRKVIMTLREATLSQSEHKALGKLLGSLTHLEPEPVAAIAAIQRPAINEAVLRQRNAIESLNQWVQTIEFPPPHQHSFTVRPVQTSASSVVGKRVYRADNYKKTDPNKQIGVVKQELITGELIVDFIDTPNPKMWSRPLSRSVLEIIE